MSLDEVCQMASPAVFGEVEEEGEKGIASGPEHNMADAMPSHPC